MDTDTSEEDASESTGDAPQPSSSVSPQATPVLATTQNTVPPPIDILISFDTTGSMSYYLNEVKNEINNMIHRLFMDIPNLKIFVIAHGDHCDAIVYYLTPTMDLTANVEDLCEMVKNVEGTDGGDFEQCYELIMRMARQVKWTPGSQRALVMIGHACPNTPESLTEMGKEPIDWKVEAAALKYEMGVKMYGVQCQDHKEAGTFWQDMAALTKGQHLKLDKFATIIDIILAICYRECGPNHLQAYELEVRAREGRMLASELDQAFQVLRGGPTPVVPNTAPSGSKPTPKESAKTAPKSVKLIASVKTNKAATSVSKAKKDDHSNKQRGIKAPVTKNTARETSKTTGNKRPKVAVRKVAREQITEAHFALNQLTWTPWTKVIAMHDHGAPAVWQKQQKGLGYKCTDNLSVMDKFKHRRAMYEVAVQLKPRGKQIIVYNHITKGISNPNRHWSKVVFKAKVNRCINNLLFNCNTASVSVRRALLPRSKKIFGESIGTAATCRAFIKRNYDYAWNGQKFTRTLIKNGVAIAIKQN